ncbi:hypothetical protein KZZ52_01590 [Dactylosporangium sp. AC04546]|uniref:hypothetical protein n=1 Tax=Dactylosporangium sp. AC04546 TaxID=2862460 RepID=UPI001EDDF7CB|nr:hypothetical protein [Dactylosporangium sp. AC04546]WVK84158.1 hypothetical protein KZZ52_01590 [Dactylosporangium sp. AC04546]
MSAGWEIAAGFALGLLANELCDVSPWLARRIVPLAARLWTTDEDRRAIYAEAWQAVIDERPGKLFKLTTALAFLGGGTVRFTSDRLVNALLMARLTSRWELVSYGMLAANLVTIIVVMVTGANATLFGSLATLWMSAALWTHRKGRPRTLARRQAFLQVMESRAAEAAPAAHDVDPRACPGPAGCPVTPDAETRS